MHKYSITKSVVKQEQIQYSIINHSINKDILISLIKNLKRFCNPHIITYVDYDYKLDIPKVFSIESYNDPTIKILNSFITAKSHNVDKLVIVNSLEMYFKSPVTKYDFCFHLIRGVSNGIRPNGHMNSYFENNDKLVQLKNFVSGWVNDELYMIPSHGCMFCKDFISFVCNIVENNLEKAKHISDEILLGCLVVEFMKNCGLDCYVHDNKNFNNNVSLDNCHNVMYGKYKTNHGFMLWPDRRLFDKYGIYDGHPRGRITSKLINDLLGGFIDVSSHYSSIKRFSDCPEDTTRMMLE